MEKLWTFMGSAFVMLLCARGAGAEAPSFSAWKVPAGERQRELSIEARSDELRFTTCAQGQCDEEHAVSLPLPSEARGRGQDTRFEVVTIARGRSVAHLRVPLAGGTAWEAIVAASIGAIEPRIIFSGLTGSLQGEPGERSGAMLMIRGSSVIVGRQREDVGICGRETILAPELLDPRDLSLHAAKVQRLSSDERKHAIVLRAERSSRMPAGSPLQALAASSALGSPQALTDGDPNTYWGESRGGDGRGEFVVLRASKALPLSAFHFLIRASAPDAGSSLEPKTSPKQFWLATDEQLYSVKMPEDGWQKPGISYRVVLPKAIQSECVALVLESSFSTRKDAEVVLAELSAETPLDGRDVHDLVRALNGGGESAKAVVAALRKGGVLAFRAIAEDFSGLDERGRELALEAIDGAPCTETVPVYMAALSGPYPGQKTHVESRLARCGGDLGRAIATELRSATTPLETKLKLAKMLPAIAPDVCALTLPALLESAEPAVRATYRDLLTSVADAPSAGPPLRAALVDSTLGHSARFDLVRSLSPWARRYEPELGRTFSELIRPPLGFEEHYLMLSPAAQLASFDKRASDFLRAAFRSDVAELRLEAVRKADPLEFEPELRVAANDPSVRVREAALEALLPKESAEKLLLERLEDDEWPLIRAAAARALARLPASVTVDDGLIDALDDESRHVRRPAVTALGVRHSAQAAPRLRELIAKDDEDPYVRAAAATSLGQMCDLGALDVLTSYAQKLVSPELPEYEILVARAATMALASLGPRDLKARLGPLSKTGASPLARRIAREALALPARCDAPRARSAEASN